MEDPENAKETHIEPFPIAVLFPGNICCGVPSFRVGIML